VRAEEAARRSRAVATRSAAPAAEVSAAESFARELAGTYAASTRRKPLWSRGRGAGQKHAHVAQALELAVHRDARKRGQVGAMLGKKHARPRRHGGIEADLARQAKLARAGRAGVADRIGEMARRVPSAASITEALIFISDRASSFGHLLEHDVVDRVRSDRDQRIAGKSCELVPAHAELGAERRHVDPVAPAQLVHRGGAPPVPSRGCAATNRIAAKASYFSRVVRHEKWRSSSSIQADAGRSAR